jgi:hypothetical protein
MASVATVEVSLTGVEPVSSFIAACCKAADHFYSLTPEQMASLPHACAAGIAELQSALSEIGQKADLVRELP